MYRLGDALAACCAAEEGQRACDTALSLFRELKSRRAEAYALEQLAELRLLAGRPQEAVQAAQQARALFGELGCARGEVLALTQLVRAHIAKGELSWALTLAQEGEARFKKQSEAKWRVCVQADALLHAHLAQDEHEAASATAQRALQLCRSMGDKHWEARLLDTMTTLCIIREDHDSAVTVGRDALELFAAVGNQRGAGSVNYRLSGVEQTRGHSVEAARLADEARELFKKAGARASEVLALLAGGHARQAQGQKEAAHAASEEAIGLARQYKDPRGEAAALVTMAAMALSGEGEVDLDAALSKAREAEALLRSCGPTGERLLADTLHFMAVVFLHSQAFDMAPRLAHEAHVLYQRAGDKAGEVDALRMIACVDLELLLIDLRNHARSDQKDAKKLAAVQRRQASALRGAEKAVAVARKSCPKPLLAASLHLLAQVRNACGHADEAAQVAEEAAGLFMECDDLDGEASALVVAADACVLQRKRQQAAAFVDRAVEMFQKTGNAEGEALAKSILAGSASITASFEALTDDPGTGEASVAASDATVKQGLQLEVAKNMVWKVAQEAIGDEDAIDYDSPLMDIGIDSLSAIAFRESLVRASSLKIPSSLVFDYPSLMAVADFLVETSLES